MGIVNPCRKDRHKFESLRGSIAGLGRRSCVACGAVQIDLRGESDEVPDPTLVFAARRPTLFSVRTDTPPEESFAVTAGLRAKSRRR